MFAIRLLVLIATLFESIHSQELVDGTLFGKMYFVGGGTESFPASKEYCVSHRGQLIRIDSLEEATFVKQIARNKFGTTSIGVNGEKIKGSYVWPNGDQVRVSTWAPGYPSCVAACCRLILSSSQGWYDYTCDYAVHFVCEISLNGADISPLNMNVPNFRNWTVTKIENLEAGEVSTRRVVNQLAQDNEKTSKYFLTDEVYNITSAKDFCESRNCHLAIVASEWEEGLMRRINRDTKPWIGLENVNGTYKWLGKHVIEYENWNDGATLHTLEELLQMQTEFPANLNQVERLGLLAQISEQFARYRNKWGVEVVECMAVYMESDGTWNVDRCSAMRRGVCERKTWLETKTAEAMKDLKAIFEDSVVQLGLQKREMENKIKVLVTRHQEQLSRLEKQNSRLEGQHRETQQQIRQLVSDLNLK